MYPEAYWDELLPLHNMTMTVEEGSATIISPQYLHYFHPEISEQEIVFEITKIPRYGNIVLKRSGDVPMVSSLIDIAIDNFTV